MGLSHVTAAALVYAGVTFAAFSITTDLFDRDADVDAAWREARDLEQDILNTRISITGVAFRAGDVEVDLSNDGATTLDMEALTVLFEGVPEPVLSFTVEGASSSVWPPGTAAQLILDGPTPDSVSVTTAHGTTAYWRG